MTIRKKSLAIILAITLIILGLDLAVRFFVDLGPVRARITKELTERLQAEVAIDHIELDVLPRPQLQVHGLRLEFVDGTVLDVPLVSLVLTFKGLFVGRPEIVRISLEAPDVRLALHRQEQETDNRTAEERQKELALFIESSLQTIPRCSVAIHDGIVHITAPDNSLLVLENVEAEADATPQGLRVSVDCTSDFWKKLAVAFTYHDPEAILELDVRGVDTEKGMRLFKAFAGENLPAADIPQSLSGFLSSVSLKVSLPHVAAPLTDADISGSGSFEDISVSFPEMGLEVRELAGDFEVDNSSIAASGISAWLGNSRIQEGVLHLDRAQGFKPTLVTSEFNLDLSEVPGLLHLIPDPDVRSEIALIKDPRGTATGTFTLRAESGSYSMDIAVKELLLQSEYRDFPPELELSQGVCTYSEGLLSFDGFAGKLGSSTLPDFSLSFSLREDEHFTAAASGATVDLADLRMVLDSFNASKELIENITHVDGRVNIRSLAFEGPLTEPASWTIAVDARFDDVSVAVAGLDGPLAVRSGILKADQKACMLSQADITYLDARLTGACTLGGYFDGIRTATAEARGLLGEKALAGIESLIDMPPVLALRAPVEIERSRLEWSRGGAVIVAGDFVLGGESTVGLNLRADSSILEIKELKIRDIASQCKIGIKIEEDLFSLTYEGMLKKDTLDRMLVENPFLQGWIQGDFNATFNQKRPNTSSATGTLSWDKAGYPAVDALPVNISSATITARDSTLVFDSAGLTAGQDSAGMHGSVSFIDEAFVLDLNVSADSIDMEVFEDSPSSDPASSGGTLDEFWQTPLRGTVSVKARELINHPYACAPFNAVLSFADKAVTMTTEGTKLCGIDFPAEVQITPDVITLEAQPRAIKASMEEIFRCLTGEKAIITGNVDIEGSLRSQGKPETLLDGLGGDFLITARNGRIYKSGLIAKILSFLSIRGILSGGITDMVKKGYAYQSLQITGAVEGQTVQVQQAILISSSFTLVSKGALDFKSNTVDLVALATPFQIQNQLLSKIPFVGGWLSKPVIGVPLKITGKLDDPKISTRTTSAVTKGLMDITKGIINVPIRIIDSAFGEKPSEEQ